MEAAADLAGGLLGRRFHCTCGQEHHVPTDTVELQEDAAVRLARYVKELAGGGKVLVAGDSTTMTLGATVRTELRRSRVPYEGVVMNRPGRGFLKATLASADTLALRLTEGFAAAVAVGSGTVNDLVKFACTRARLPYVVFATAPSMNGYPSGIAALEVHGIKRTMEATPPRGIFADPRILAAAPRDLLRAGFGDAISKPVSGADWRMATWLRGGSFCPFALDLVRQAEAEYLAHAQAIGRGEAAGVAALTRALILSGVSMVVAGSSSPASGGEHLISHYWDLRSALAGRAPRLHGLQVGVATVVTATLYEEVLGLDSIDVTGCLGRYRDTEAREPEIRSRYGRLADETLAEVRAKQVPRDRKLSELERMRVNWPQWRSGLRAMVVPARQVREALAAAGCPTRAEDLGVTGEELEDAILHAREIRGRYTVLDLADDLGLLEGFARRAAHGASL
ncbi:MAG: sn-glycerol-1-phosphate dehydrogenase [Planctomycetes bacterium]|nr:sn-glycerol-1-phosphate dehydrogenase [Planctomycetota bacterium]